MPTALGQAARRSLGSARGVTGGHWPPTPGACGPASPPACCLWPLAFPTGAMSSMRRSSAGPCWLQACRVAFATDPERAAGVAKRPGLGIAAGGTWGWGLARGPPLMARRPRPVGERGALPQGEALGPGPSASVGDTTPHSDVGPEVGSWCSLQAEQGGSPGVRDSLARPRCRGPGRARTASSSPSEGRAGAAASVHWPSPDGGSRAAAARAGSPGRRDTGLLVPGEQLQGPS